jgi:hypothetical protein
MSITTKKKLSKMKTMKITTAQKNLQKAVESGITRKGTNAYIMVARAIEGQKIIRPFIVYGSGKRASAQDHSIDVKKILDFCKIAYISYNDAPRGGNTGKAIQITTTIKAAELVK